MAEYPGTAFDPGLMGQQSWAFDAVYTPTQTMFLRDANVAGLSILTGFDLFRSMALRSFEAYTGLHVDDAALHSTLDALRPD
jgi:shikimate dehydrogenase